MNIDDLTTLLATLRGRGVDFSLKRDGRLRVCPWSGLSADEQVLLREHAAQIAELLRPAPPDADAMVLEPVLTVDEILRAEEDREERALEALMRPPKRERVFHTLRGFVGLRQLEVNEVRRLEKAGRLSAEEIHEWARSRKRSLFL